MNIYESLFGIPRQPCYSLFGICRVPIDPLLESRKREGSLVSLSILVGIPLDPYQCHFGIPKDPWGAVVCFLEYIGIPRAPSVTFLESLGIPIR